MDNAEYSIKNMDNAELANYFTLHNKHDLDFFIAIKTSLSFLHTMDDLCYWLMEKQKMAKNLTELAILV